MSAVGTTREVIEEPKNRTYSTVRYDGRRFYSEYSFSVVSHYSTTVLCICSSIVGTNVQCTVRSIVSRSLIPKLDL